jgi:hypothetical protein
MQLLAIGVLLFNRAFRQLIKNRTLAIFRCIGLEMEREFEVRGSEVNARKQSVSNMLVCLLMLLFPSKRRLLSSEQIGERFGDDRVFRNRLARYDEQTQRPAKLRYILGWNHVFDGT